MKAELIPENGDPPIPIRRDVTVIGRRDYCDIQIDHPTISRRHCILVRTSGLLILRDLATTNGTKVKGQRIRWAALLPNDRLSLGGYKVRVYLGPDDQPSPSETLGRAGSAADSESGFAAPTPPVFGVPEPPEAPEPQERGEDLIELQDDDVIPEDMDSDPSLSKFSSRMSGDPYRVELD